MKKQELIHLHGLFAEVSNQFEEWNGAAPDLAEYESLGIQPTSIHKSKTDHKEAVFALAQGVTDEMAEEAASEPVAATAD